MALTHRLSLVAGASTGKIGFHKEKVSHGDSPCYSMDKVYTVDELLHFACKIARTSTEKFDIEVKYDGLTGSLSHGILSTSGEGGLVGVDISDKLPIINIEYAPGTEKITKNLRGEIILKKSVFADHKHLFVRKSNGKPYKIPRSACVAQVMSEDNIESIGAFLTFVIFGKHQKTMTLEELQGFDLEGFAKAVQQMDYPADGLVVKLQDREYLASLGATSHHQHGEMSLKFGNPTGETTILDIERSVGKGRITPVAIIEPVEIEGILNRRASLHNAAFIKEKDICIGDRISVERCGSIIPGFLKTLNKPETRRTPEMGVCPACNAPTIFDGVNETCNNDQCSGTLACQIYDSVVRIGIETLGKTTVQKLIETHDIKNLSDIFYITVEQASELEGFADISAQNLFTAVQQVKNKPINDWRILASLNISGIGRRMSQTILKDRTLSQLRQMSTNELLAIDDIGEIRAALIHLTLQEYSEYIDELIVHFPSIINTVDHQDVELHGVVCFTGKTPVKSETRNKHWKPFAETHGFEVSSTIKKNTTILVTGDLGSTSSKMKKAEANNTQIMDYEAFREMVQ